MARRMSEKKIRIWTIKGAAAVLTIVFYAVLYTNLDPTMWQIAMCAVATYELIIYIIRSFMLYRRERRREIRREREAEQWREAISTKVG